MRGGVGKQESDVAIRCVFIGGGGSPVPGKVRRAGGIAATNAVGAQSRWQLPVICQR